MLIFPGLSHGSSRAGIGFALTLGKDLARGFNSTGKERMDNRSKNRTTLLLIVGLIAAFGSTSFAAKATEVPKAVSKANQSGQKTDGKGGGTVGQEKSCLPGAKAIGFKAEQVGLKEGDLNVNVTERGAEFTICGKTKIATDPSSRIPKNQPGQPPNKERSAGWCILNEDFAKALNVDPKKFTCEKDFADAPGAQTKTKSDGSKTITVEFKIKCDGTELKANLITETDKDGKVTDSKIIMKGSDPDKNTNQLELKSFFQEVDDENVKGKITLAEKPNSGSSPDKEAGSFHLPIEGKIKKDQQDPDYKQKFESCKVDVDGKGPKNENESSKPVSVPLAGSCVIYRGAMVPMISESYAGCRTSNTETGNISMMQERSPKSGGGMD